MRCFRRTSSSQKLSSACSSAVKKCPFCAEEIQDGAIVCKHCKRDLPKQQTTETIGCPFCKAVIPKGSRVCPACGDDLSGVSDVGPSPKRSTKKIGDTRCTCSSCGNVWHYGKAEVLESTGAAMQNIGKSMMCCSGCVPAAAIPDKKVVDLNRCPKCGSRAITKQTVEHEVP